jgi:hypothetical protein
MKLHFYFANLVDITNKVKSKTLFCSNKRLHHCALFRKHINIFLIKKHFYD